MNSGDHFSLKIIIIDGSKEYKAHYSNLYGYTHSNKKDMIETAHREALRVFHSIENNS